MTCLLDPIGCFTEGLSSWFHSIPLLWLLGAAVVAGMILGAILGRWGVGAAVGVLVAILALSRNKPAEPEVFEHEDPKPIRRVKPRPAHRETVSDWFKRTTGQD
ncbi:MAG: hypothetical protein JWR51_4689 [Devosia sp.]|uniref:hypothetical protein n=1 Tax=Devosia sp. TaxID=1871048 RepID=UPI00260D1721|nr:hypothetical protein [Devosia sp.]MDB5531586.1 hypothetical protein [Devosia sp.]